MMLSLALGLSSKRPRTTSRSPATPDGPDHLSPLPVEMVEEILRRLPLDDAVRTSALAKPWRYRWAECPGLELVAGDPPAAVDAVLNRYTCNVSRAQLDVPEESYCKIDGWLRALATKGIRYLVVCFTPVLLLRLPLLPSSLFSCRELTSLLLKHCDIPPLPPSFDSFPNLLALQLDDVSFVENGERTFEALIAKCPSLRSLILLFPSIGSDHMHEGNYSDWTIRAPNLKHFIISAWQDYGWRIDDLPLIEEARVHLEGPELPRILPGLSKVKNLSVEITDDTIVERLSYFMNLKDLSLHTILITKSSTVLSMFCILRNAPNLEDLRITSLHESEENDEVNMEELLNAQRTVGLFSRLKCFCLFESIGHTNEMQFIEFLMSKATVLQEIEISVRDDGSKSPEVVFDELSQYKKASPQAEVIVNRTRSTT
ncbi:F-box/FBD/LRR-repeat protein At1g13570-like [Setaria italica]|uniref:F-box/FBD/LRR-repeat protein At1g13570-like n=1 Tax=Setaria italica TaxID=4555 RepID=UPI000351314E|nr:F-box/FBD/LRR-repeat protein At1g13570-like [Setaria italica]